MDRPEFAAFLSYSHRDARWANWLHRAIETYIVPPHLAGREGAYGTIPKRLRPIFRDRDELAASPDLNERIEAALAGSRALVVLCSPAAACSRWTDQEIRSFKRLYPDRPILAAIVAGEPYASAIPGREDEEAFPPALRFRIGADGELSDERAEPIAADLRPEADGRRLGKFKVIAGMLGVGLDVLVRRDAARRHRRLAWLAAASLGGMAAALGLALYAFDQRAEAVRQREQADGLIEFMLTDLRKKLEPVGRLDVLDSVGERALQYYAAQKLANLDADALGRRSQALLLVGEVAVQRGNTRRAMAGFRDAGRTTSELLDRDPDNWQRVYDHMQSVYWIGSTAGDLGDQAERLRQFRLYATLGRRLLDLRPNDRRSQLEAAYGQSNLGFTYRGTDRFDQALAAFRAAQAQFSKIEPRDREVMQSIAQTHALIAAALYQLGRNREAIAECERQLAILAAAPFAASDRDVERDVGYALRMEGLIYLALGDSPRSTAALTRAAQLWQRLIAVDPTNEEWIEGLAATRTTRALGLFVTGHAAEARAMAAQATATMAPLHGAEPNDDQSTQLLLNAYSTRALAGDRSIIDRLQALVGKLRGDERFAHTLDHRMTLAAALVALGLTRRQHDPAAARRDWLAARDLLGGTTKLNTWGEIQRVVIARRLGETPVDAARVDLAVAYGGYFAH